MIPQPGALGGTELVGWRLDRARHGQSWDSGEGAYLFGGRWNNEGVRAVYASLDSATAIMEVVVHKGFDTLDTEAHVLTWFRIEASADIHVVKPMDVPDPHWLAPGISAARQKKFGDGLLSAYDFVVLPSAVSSHSWNILFDPGRVSGFSALIEQEQFVLDPAPQTHEMISSSNRA